MGVDKETCPACGEDGISPWAWLYAGWPAHAVCFSCGAKIRVKTSLMLNMLGQTAGVICLLIGMVEAWEEFSVVAVLLIAVGLLMFVLPQYFGRLITV